MELHQLEYFVAVAEEASFTKAAARVHVAQPGVSAQVRRLEAELGQQLLDRSGRSVRLTEVGAAVLPFARAALDAVANARLTVDQLAGLVRGQVTVGMVSGCALPVLAVTRLRSPRAATLVSAGRRRSMPGEAPKTRTITRASGPAVVLGPDQQGRLGVCAARQPAQPKKSSASA